MKPDNLYFKLLRESLGLSQLPVKPESLPWLATITFPNPEAFALDWLADCEQCFSFALIEEFRDGLKIVK